MVELAIRDGRWPRRLVFSGDVGQWDKPIVRDPTVFTQADFVVLESTYGDRNHESHGDIESQLAEVINHTSGGGGNVVVPIFAIERAQELMYHISRLARADRIPAMDVFLDSPMAASVTGVFGRHRECFDAETLQLVDAGQSPLRFPGLRMIRTVEESKAINRRRQPAIIMATSGMCVAGRIKHHLRHNITRPECTILFVGYQGRGTLGRQILDGDREVRIHGRFWPVRARIAQIHGFSGHVDRLGLLRWLSYFQAPPRQLFLTHGEQEAALSLTAQIHNQMGWQVLVPEYQQVFELE